MIILNSLAIAKQLLGPKVPSWCNVAYLSTLPLILNDEDLLHQVGKPFLLHNHKYMLTIYNFPIASLAIPISVLVSMPVWVIPVVVRVHCGAARPVHHLSGV